MSQGDIIVDKDTETISEIPEEFQVKGRPKGQKWSHTSVNLSGFANTVLEMVDHIPWDVDGQHQFRLFCEPDDWIDRQRDGQWFKMNSSSHKGFPGIRKIGVCQGSHICHNVQCSKLQTEGVCNTSSAGFYPERGMHVCRSCGYYAVQIHCGCKKVTEYNPVTKELDVYYEGNHICTPKPDVLTKCNFF